MALTSARAASSSFVGGRRRSGCLTFSRSFTLVSWWEPIRQTSPAHEPGPARQRARGRVRLTRRTFGRQDASGYAAGGDGLRGGGRPAVAAAALVARPQV